MEDDRTISNKREYSGRNILERNRSFRNNKNQNGIMKRKVVNKARTAN